MSDCSVTKYRESPILTEKRLKVHVIGAGEGESIILEMPDGKWGVVDCYSPSIEDRTENQTLNFLRRNNVEGLEFLCLTHPHEDHYRGMTHLIEEFNGNILRFWRFPPRPLVQVLAHIEATSIEKEKYLVKKTSVAELTKLFKLVSEMRREADKRSVEFVELVEGFKPLLSSTIHHGEKKTPLRIFALGPAGNLIDTYQEVVEKYSLDRIRCASKIHRIHNLISGVLLVTYGKTRVILGGDAVKKNWKYILSDSIRTSSNGESIAACLVKVSHHGSSTSLVYNLWKTLTANKDSDCYAVITPFAAHRLPERQVIEHISSYRTNIFLTCLDSLKFSYKPRELLREYTLKRQLERAGIAARIIPSSPSQAVCRCSFSFDPDGDCIEGEFEGSGGQFLPA